MKNRKIYYVKRNMGRDVLSIGTPILVRGLKFRVEVVPDSLNLFFVNWRDWSHSSIMDGVDPQPTYFIQIICLSWILRRTLVFDKFIIIIWVVDKYTDTEGLYINGTTKTDDNTGIVYCVTEQVPCFKLWINYLIHFFGSIYLV